MSTSLPQRTPAPPPAAMLPPEPDAPTIDGAQILAVLAAPGMPRGGVTTPQLNCELQDLGLGTMPLSDLGRALEALRAEGLVGRHRPPNHGGAGRCAPRRYWATEKGRARVRVDEGAACP